MFVIWKRPDGFHGASPADYEVFDVGESKIWLHQTEKEEFPFRVSGGWQDGEATKRLNRLVNQLPQDNFAAHLVSEYEHSMKSEGKEFIEELEKWLQELKDNPKGDTWETEIIVNCLSFVQKKIEEAKDDFLVKLKSKE